MVVQIILNQYITIVFISKKDLKTKFFILFAVSSYNVYNVKIIFYKLSKKVLAFCTYSLFG